MIGLPVGPADCLPDFGNAPEKIIRGLSISHCLTLLTESGQKCLDQGSRFIFDEKALGGLIRSFLRRGRTVARSASSHFYPLFSFPSDRKSLLNFHTTHYPTYDSCQHPP